MELLKKAIEFSKDFHKEHKRIMGNEDMHAHILRVIDILKEEGLHDSKILTATALHHILGYPNKEQNAEFIKKEFGPQVLDLLNNYYILTQKKVKLFTPKEENKKYVIQSFLNMTENLDALVIRLADKLDNLNMVFAFDHIERDRIANRAINIYAPLAKFVGLNGISSKLENQAFKILHPAEYYKIDSYIQTIKPEIDQLFAEIKPFIKDLLKEYNINNPSLSFRIKKPYSTFLKMRTYAHKGIKVSDDPSSLPDFIAMRIIVDTVDQCYLADSLLKSLWDPIEKNSEDLIAHPRPSGYKSLHSLFKISSKFNLEVQIRTYEMHEYNEMGPASHLFYKVGGNFKQNLYKDPDWLKKLDFWDKTYFFEKDNNGGVNDVSNLGLSSDLSADVGAKPFSENIYVFTPKGDIIELKRGSTVIDFAYAIHESVGKNFMGATVNGAIARADHVLKDGDVIAIRASKKDKLPSRDWLNFVVTSKARSYIRKELRLG